MNEIKTKTIRRWQAVPTKVTIEVEFDHPEFIKMVEFLAMSHDTPISKVYGRLIQSCLGSYAGNHEGKFIDDRVELLYDYIGSP